MHRTEFQIYERILERMVAANWVRKDAFRAGKTPQIEWTEEGRRRARLLKRIIESFQLNTDLAKAVRFDTICENSLLEQPAPGAVDREIARFWRSCLNDLNVATDESDFLCLIHGVQEFGPYDEGISRIEA